MSAGRRDHWYSGDVGFGLTGVCPQCLHQGRAFNFHADDPDDRGSFMVCHEDFAWWKVNSQWFPDAPLPDDPCERARNLRVFERCEQVIPAVEWERGE